MKKFTLGLIVGIIISFSVTAFAAVQLTVLDNPFPVFIDGQAADVEAYNINGFTFLKLADFGKTGLTIKFNETDRKIEVTSKLLTDTGVDDMSDEIIGKEITQTPDGITQIDLWEGKQYIGVPYIRNIIRPKGYNLVKFTTEAYIDPETSMVVDDVGDDKWKLIKGTYDTNKNRVEQSSNYTILIEDVPMTLTFGSYDSVEADYYINTILPLIK